MNFLLYSDDIGLSRAIVKIVDQTDDLELVSEENPGGVDVVVCPLPGQDFYTAVDAASRIRKPLVIGMTDLTKVRLDNLALAASEIPIFCSGNMYITVEKFVRECQQFAQTYQFVEEGESFLLHSTCSKDAPLFGAVTSTILDELLESREFPRTVRTLQTSIPQPRCVVGRWSFGTQKCQSAVFCHTESYPILAEDILQIARIMATKSVAVGKFYDLRTIWSDIPPEVFDNPLRAVKVNF